MNGLDSNYPTFEPPETAFNPKYDAKGKSINLIVDVDDYVIDREGRICIATTSNRGPYPNEFLRDINEGSFRARFIGESDDGLECANQCRLATAAEIKIAREFEKSIVHVSNWKGQMQLL